MFKVRKDRILFELCLARKKVEEDKEEKGQEQEQEEE